MKTWGSAQTRRYTQGLRACFQLLAENPSLGRTCDAVHPGLRRLEHGKHVVFYLSQADGVLIVRVLHQQMVPTKPRFEP
jgi:toxin ParE1/3/4